MKDLFYLYKKTKYISILILIIILFVIIQTRSIYAQECHDGNYKNVGCNNCGGDCTYQYCVGGTWIDQHATCNDDKPEPGCQGKCGGGGSTPSCGDGSVNQGSEECDDGNTNNGDGCDSKCKLECGNITINTDDQMTRLSGTQPLALSWDYNQTSTDPRCNPTSYTVHYVEKPSFDVADKSDCFKDADGNDITGTEIIVNDTSKTNVTVEINNGTNNIDWQKPYCWKVQVNKEAEKTVEAGPNSFRTNYAPIFSRAGIQFVDNTRTQLDQQTQPWGIDPVNSGNPVCSSGWDVSCNTITNDTDLNLGGENVCWLAGHDPVDAPGQDHTIYLWFEYFDPDNEPVSQEPNESQRHRLAFVEKDFFNPIESASNIQNAGNVSSGNTLFYSHFANLLSTETPSITTQEGNTNISIVESKRLHFNNNKVRIIYKIRFNRDVSYTGHYDIYEMMEHNVDDPNIGFTGENLGDHFTGIDPSTGKQYQKIGTFSIDNEEPEVGVNPPIINGYHSFNLTWLDQTGTQGSDLKTFKGYCYSDNSPSFNLIYLGPYSPNPETKTLDVIDINRVPAGYNECLPLTAKIEVIANGTATTNYSFENNLHSYRRFDDLVISTIDAEDKACNVNNDPYIDPQKLFDPWITTRQGTVHSDGSIDINTPFEVDSSIRTDNSLYYGQWPFYNNTPPELIRISSNMLSSQVATLTNQSLNNQKITNYFDLNYTPKFGPVADNWYDYFKGFLENAGLSSSMKQISGDKSINSISSLNPSCTNHRCFYEINGNLTIGPANPSRCDKQSLIFIQGNLTIIDDFTNNGSPNNACIFIVKGNITFENGSQPLDADPSMGGNTAPYNGVAGFFISDSSIDKTIKVKKDAQMVTGSPYADALVIRGGLVSDNVEFRRNVGLRNNIQPAEIILYDPRYIILFEDILGYSLLTVREK
ncbi:hypothetical protein GF362_05195 [Candidatus Dojkabacteria bacterium]|nr:hypothetical protein [Candidatus Dojkabacteria bacterium]